MCTWDMRVVSSRGAAEAGVSKEESKATEPTFPSEPPAFSPIAVCSSILGVFNIRGVRGGFNIRGSG